VPPVDIRSYLKDQGVPFEVTAHPLAFTAQEVAQAVHVSGYRLAKVVVLKVDGAFVMAVLPGAMRVDLARFKQVAGARRVDLASESEFERLFPGCERGAMPPFGNLYDVPVYVDQSLAGRDRIVFNAGNHIETIRVAYSDYERLVKPRLGSFSQH